MAWYTPSLAAQTTEANGFSSSTLAKLNTIGNWQLAMGIGGRMMYVQIFRWVLAGLIFFACSSSAYEQQTARIDEIYFHENGSIALKLDGGFSDAMKAECESFNGYAGSRTADDILKAFLLAQYAAEKEVKLGVDGCDGAWLKITTSRGFL